MTSLRSATTVVTTLAMAGCGVMFNEKERLVLVESTPPGAEVEVDGKPAGRTPLQVMLPTHRSSIVTVERGGQAQVCPVDARIEPLWVLLDIWFLVPLIVDAATGGWNDVPASCVVAFGRAAPEPAPRQPETPLIKPAPKEPTKPTTPVKPAPEPEPKPKPFPFPK